MGNYIAVDLGASNGRTMLGRFDGKKITLQELNRFETHYTRINDAYYWDLIGIYKNILEGLRAYAKQTAEPLLGIGIDTWGCDFGLIDRQGKLIGYPRAYRDPRSRRGMKAFHARYGEKTAFELTGIANLEFNTLYQLYDMVQTNDPQLLAAEKLLLMADLLGYLLTGQISNEYTFATTTQMLDKDTGTWSKELIGMLGISEELLAPIRMSGTLKGQLFDFIKEDTGLRNIPPVFNVGSHDTASAVASVPARNDNFAFISSGTWSLIGMLSDKAIISDEFFVRRFSNEGTVDGAYRPLRNIMGLWVIQNCKRQWDREQKLSWKDIDVLVDKAPAFRSFIDINAHQFFDADNMTQKIQEFCKATGQPVPQTKGEIARTVYESLAMSYREAFEGLEQIKGGRIDVLHIVGGGSRNILLNQITADAINRPVIAGPDEATAIGNLMVQVKAAGEVSSADEMRQVIRESFDVEVYEPRNTEVWDEQYQRYLKIKAMAGEGS